MGLPLFVASVESDISSKMASKGASASPSRSGIRRLGRTTSRERRNQARTAASVRIYGAVPPRPPPRSNQDGLLPWVEPPGAEDQNAPEPRSQPPSIRELREAGETPWQRAMNGRSNRQLFEDQMASLFGNDWRERSSIRAAASQREPEPRDTNEQWWPMEARSSRARRAQVVAPLPSRFDDNPERTRSYRGSPPLSDRVLGSNGLPASNQAAGNAPQTSAPRYNARIMRSLRNRPSPPSRRVSTIDGLGDRDRSLSPEGWDTLLATLAPDPQPPSAGSSFASTVASQSAAQTSNTSTSAPDALDDAAADAQCDSGEHSEASIEEDEEDPAEAAMRTRERILREARRRASPLNLDGSVDGPGASEWPADGDRLLRAAGLNLPTGRDSPPEIGGEAPRGEAPRGMPLARLLNGTESWVRHEAALDENGGDGSRLSNQTGATGAAHTMTLAGEEDWSGMQRIVRSLARREDIPDEWWAEVGLSRTLPQDDAATQ